MLQKWLLHCNAVFCLSNPQSVNCLTRQKLSDTVARIDQQCKHTHRHNIFHLTDTQKASKMHAFRHALPRQHPCVNLKQRHMGLIRHLRGVLIQMEPLQTVMFPSRLGQPSMPQTHTPHLLRVKPREKTGRRKKTKTSQRESDVQMHFFPPF